MGYKKLKNEELLEYFKVPFAVSLREDFLITLRVFLQESIESVLSSQQHSLVDLMELLNLLKIYSVNVHCLVKCRVDQRVLLSETELTQVRNKLVKAIEKLQTLPVSDEEMKADGEIPKDKIIMFHIKTLAAEVSILIETEIDFESSLSKLKNLESTL